MVKIIGIDPGLASTGIAVVEGLGLSVAHYAFGSIETDPRDALPERLRQIFDRISRIITENRPDLIVVEDIFSLQKYPKSGITLGKVTGVILLAGCQAAVSIRQVAVREAKQVLTGSGNAGKAQLEACVRNRLNHPEPISPSHASDALALALVGLYRCDPRMMIPISPPEAI